MMIAIMAVAGVASMFLFSMKGLLDQLPDVIDSAGKVRDAVDRFRNKGGRTPEVDEQPLPLPEAENVEEPDCLEDAERQPPAAA
ncbi:hypothetical protein ACFQ9Z_25185 [Streptomyces sp. NPDC056580]|uniref:hypothetical protein n=1 Tax=Streptomyces sp. NPDC056580 TaxID=3345872 RepID=UPI0036991844